MRADHPHPFTGTVKSSNSAEIISVERRKKMVLNVKNLRQKSDKEYEQNFDWGMNILKGYRRKLRMIIAGC